MQGINLKSTIYLLIWILFPRFNLSMVKIRSFGKKKREHKPISISAFVLFRVIIFNIGFVLFCGFLLLFFFFLSFSWQFFLLLFSFFNFFITIFLLKTPRGLFPLWSYIMNKYCTAIASIDAPSHIWAVLMSLGPFSLFNTDILRPTALAIITIYHFILLPFFLFCQKLLRGFCLSC